MQNSMPFTPFGSGLGSLLGGAVAQQQQQINPEVLLRELGQVVEPLPKMTIPKPPEIKEEPKENLLEKYNL